MELTEALAQARALVGPGPRLEAVLTASDDGGAPGCELFSAPGEAWPGFCVRGRDFEDCLAKLARRIAREGRAA